ncbi:Nudix hydrolase 3 [Minicystis rosea]|nr:Nudix hydrolase 3 [Minicystis rosea]
MGRVSTTLAAPMKRAASFLALALGAAACEPAIEPQVAPAQTAAPTEPPSDQKSGSAEKPNVRLDRIPRADFNRIAAELNLPLFWISDEASPGVLDVNELAVLWGAAPEGGPFVQGTDFTAKLHEAYEAMAKVHTAGHPTEGLSDAEKKRRETVRLELSQGRPTLVRTDLHAASTEDRVLVDHVLAAAQIIERIYEKQMGTAGLDAGIPKDDAASRMMFHRNHGPYCQAPKTEKDPACSALPQKPPRVSGLYPASAQKPEKFCEKLEARKDQKALLGPFTVVVEKGGDLEAVPYSTFYKDEMTAVSRELAAAADAIKSAEEAPLKAYLTAASKAFLDNNWEPADEAWARMSVNNSKWYLRVGPDETYADPCSRKAGFHVSFARINQDSLAWQKKLDPVKRDMEEELAKMAGAPYKARKVAFHLPDFIDMVLNAGDSRASLGATIGQSLPNWGPVANEGRGRTVAMTNLYTDPDSRASQREKAESLLCKATFDPAAIDPALTVMTTVLHEAAHNLGPAHEYKVKGKTDAETFGGPLAGMLEELKAQTSALYLGQWLVKKGIVEDKRVRLGHQADILWAFGHISEGMYGESGTPKPYSQLSAIQVGSFVKAGAMKWNEGEMAANGKDKGCFSIVEDKLPAAITALEKQVLAIKAKGDKAAALKLRGEMADADGEWKRLRGVITERWLRAPKASFVYAIEK